MASEEGCPGRRDTEEGAVLPLSPSTPSLAVDRWQLAWISIGRGRWMDPMCLAAPGHEAITSGTTPTPEFELCEKIPPCVIEAILNSACVT